MQQVNIDISNFYKTIKTLSVIIDDLKDKHDISLDRVLLELRDEFKGK